LALSPTGFGSNSPGLNDEAEFSEDANPTVLAKD